MGWGSVLLNLFTQGYLGGDPARLRKLKEEALRTKLELYQKPIWEEKIETSPRYPEEAQLPTGQIIPDIITKRGPTYGEAGAFADIARKSPLIELFRGKAGGQAISPWMEKFFPPDVTQKALKGPMWTTEPGRRWEQYLQFLSGLQKLEEAKKISPDGEEGEIDGDITPPSNRPPVSYTPGVKDLLEALNITMGIKKPIRQEEYVGTPGGVLEKKTGELRPYPPKPFEETKPPKYIWRYKQWRKTAPPGKDSYPDFMRWEVEMKEEVKAAFKKDPLIEKAWKQAWEILAAKYELRGLKPKRVDSETLMQEQFDLTNEIYGELKVREGRWGEGSGRERWQERMKLKRGEGFIIGETYQDKHGRRARFMGYDQATGKPQWEVMD